MMDLVILVLTLGAKLEASSTLIYCFRQKLACWFPVVSILSDCKMKKDRRHFEWRIFLYGFIIFVVGCKQGCSVLHASSGLFGLMS